MSDPKERLAAIRLSIEAEDISYGEIAELQGLVEHIDPTDVVLLQWAGVPEFPESTDTTHVCADGSRVQDRDVPFSVNEQGDRTCTACGERILVCADCGEPLQDDPRDLEPNHLHCDFCTKVEHAADLTTDWNGETGNHLSCERANGKDYVVDVLVPIAISVRADSAEQAALMALDMLDESCVREDIDRLIDSDTGHAFVVSDSPAQTEVGEA